MKPFITFVEDDRHPLSCEREGDKCQERDKLRVEGMIAKLDMLWRLQTIQKNGKEYMARDPPICRNPGVGGANLR